MEDPQRADGRVYRGHAGVRESWERWLEDFDAYGFEVERITDHGDRVLVVAIEHGRGSASEADVSRPHLHRSAPSARARSSATRSSTTRDKPSKPLGCRSSPASLPRSGPCTNSWARSHDSSAFVLRPWHAPHSACRLAIAPRVAALLGRRDVVDVEWRARGRSAGRWGGRTARGVGGCATACCCRSGGLRRWLRRCAPAGVVGAAATVGGYLWAAWFGAEADGHQWCSDA